LKFSRGLAALIFIVLFHNTLFADEYLYKDDVLHNPKFTKQINQLGSELYNQTGISLKLVILKDFKGYKNILAYEQNLSKDFNKPTILLTFSQLDKQVDIYANNPSLYKYFNRNQVLSPAASFLQAFFIAITASSSYDNFVAHLKNFGGTILPILGAKSKKAHLMDKYSAALYNGYDDIAEQVAKSKGVTLAHAAGNANQDSIFFVKLLFYGFVIYAIYMYVRRFLYRRRHKNEF